MKIIKVKFINALVKVASCIYFLLLAYVTLFSARRELKDRSFRGNANFNLFSKVPLYSSLDEAGKFYFIQDILGNLILFLPFVMAVNFLIATKWSNKRLLFLMLLTIFFIESLQFVLDIGVFDVDDIVLNFTGGVAGMFLFNFIYRRYFV